MLAAAVLERVTGTPYAEAAQELVFEPHGLDRTAHATRHDVVPGRAEGYCLIDGTTCRAKEIDASSVIGTGSARSSARPVALARCGKTGAARTPRRHRGPPRTRRAKGVARTAR
ncbi:MAG: hypothetical protein DHS20C14_05790 [Phycisphaeraceae bacterium]|nr:MAG: hypothetical protein DHS20C14_05790 [Phycisphaeraceae bacterium]